MTTRPPETGGTDAARWENLRPSDRETAGVNVGRAERIVSGVIGAGMLGYGLGRRRLRAVLLPLGAELIRRAVTGRCAVNRALGRNSATGEGGSSALDSLAHGGGTRIEQSIVISRPRDELFHFWRQLDNLPRFMDNLESVTVHDDRRSHWVAKGPAGTRVEWDAEINNEIEDEIIAWRSLPGSEIEQAGSVHFTPAHNGGTEVRVVMRYAAPAGKLGDAVAHLLGEDPDQQVANDLRRFKQVVEANEAASFTPGAGTL